METTSNVLAEYEKEHPELLGKGNAIDVTPHPSLLPKMGKVGYAVEEAIAELVDNAVDAPYGEEAVSVNITFGGIGDEPGARQYLEIVDLGRGMTPDEAGAALVLGHSNKDSTKIGHFGMGMKTACTFLGKRFVVETATAHDDQASIVVYDEDEFVRRGEWKVVLYRKPKNFDHGTRITVEKLYVNLKGHGRGAVPGNRPIDRTEKLLARQHRVKLQRGELHLIIGGKPLQAEAPDWDDLYSPVQHQFEFEVFGKKVHGIVGIVKKKKRKKDIDLVARGEDYGLDLYRNGRLVKEYEKLGFNPHTMARNIYGVVHLDGFPVTNNKRDFIRDSDAWGELEHEMKRVLLPISRAIAKYYDAGLGKVEDPASEYKLVWDEVEDKVEWVRRTSLALVPDGVEATAPGARAPDDLANAARAEQKAENSGDTAVVEAPELTDASGTSASVASVTQGPEQPSEAEPDVDESADQAGITGGLPTFARTGYSFYVSERKNDPQVGWSGEGVLAGVRFRHHLQDHRDGLYKSAEQVVTSEGMCLQVTTNSAHGFYPATCALHWHRHNVAEAIAEYLADEQGLSAGQMIGLKSELLAEIMKAS